MLLRAIKNEQRRTDCRALDVDIYKIRQKRDLLDGICPEVVQVLKDKRVTQRSAALTQSDNAAN